MRIGKAARRADANGCGAHSSPAYFGRVSGCPLHHGAERIRWVRGQGIGQLWIDHVKEAIMPVVDHILFLCFAQKLADRRPSEIASDLRCDEAYLGE